MDALPGVNPIDVAWQVGGAKPSPGVEGYLERCQELWIDPRRRPDPRLYDILGVAEDAQCRRWVIRSRRR